MYPHERSLVREMEGRPFALIGVNSDSTVEKAKKAVADEGLNWRSFQNHPKGAEEAIAETWGIKGWPTAILIDDQFRIRYRGHDGLAAKALAKKLVEELEARRKAQPPEPAR